MRDIPPIKKLIIPALFIIALYIFQVQRGQEQIPKWVIQGSIMGTTYTVQSISKESPSAEEIQHLLDSINQKMSTYIEESELNQFNRIASDTPFIPSQELAYVLHAADRVFQQSNGAFDITVGPLVNLWGFGPTKDKKTPTDEKIQELLKTIGSQFLHWQGDSLLKTHASLYCDLSAIAKGYAVDRVSQYLMQKGFDRHWVEIGGEVRVSGLNAQNKFWRVGIERPADQQKRSIYQIIPLDHLSMATSGDYRNHYVDDQGIERSHTIDPRSGKPITHTLASVSVLHPENMYADAWATALNVLGMQAGLKLANHYGLLVFFIERDPQHPKTKFTHHLSDEMKKYLEKHKIILKS